MALARGHTPVLDLSQQHAAKPTPMNAAMLFKPSAAFFTALRSNLLLPPTNSTFAMSSPLVYSSDTVLDDLKFETPSSPQLFTSTSTSTQQPTSPSTLDTIPPLTTDITTSESAKIIGLRLIADSIAQQRQRASYAVITHPLILAIYILLIAILFKCLYKVPSDIGIIMTTAAGLSMACLIAVRGACSGYITAAEEINVSYLDPQDERGEEILITSTFGSDIIGALVLHLEPSNPKSRSPSSPSKKSRRSHGNHHQKGGVALIRAWTTALRYRRKGIGSALLEEAVRVTRERLGRDAEIGFSVSHANSVRVLPDMFNGGIVKGERKAGKMLDEVVAREHERRKRR